MNHFLVLVPKSRSQKVASLTDQLIAEISEWIGPGFSNPTVHFQGPHKEILLYSWRRTGNDSASHGFVSANEKWVQTSHYPVAQQLLNSLIAEAGDIRYAEPVWGAYTAVYGDHRWGSIDAWQTVPSTHSVCWAETDCEYVVSDIPLLCAMYLAVKDGKEPRAFRMERAFLGEYLGLGYSITHTTPFRGVKILRARERLSIRNGEATIGRTPGGLTHNLSRDHSLTDAADALQSSLENSFQRMTALTDYPLHLRISGGRNSRLMLALVQKYKVECHAVCYGDGSDTDSRLSSFLAHAADIEYSCEGRSFAHPVDVLRSTEAFLQRSCGLPATEAHHAAYAFPTPRQLNETVVFGNWPPYHGVYHRTMKSTYTHMHDTVDGTVSRHLDIASRTRVTDILHNWLDATPATTNLHRLYEFGLVFRGGRWMQPGAFAWGQDSFCGCFMSDQELASLSDRLTMFEHVTYAPEFVVLQRLWPLAARTPLPNSTWIFEAHGPNRNQFLDAAGYAMRNMDQQAMRTMYPVVPMGRSGQQKTSSTSREIVMELVNFLRSSVTYRDTVSPLIHEGIGQKIIRADTRLTNDEIIFLWRMVLATVLMSKSWVYRS